MPYHSAMMPMVLRDKRIGLRQINPRVVQFGHFSFNAPDKPGSMPRMIIYLLPRCLGYGLPFVTRTASSFM